VSTTSIPRDKLIEGIILCLENTRHLLDVSKYTIGKFEDDSTSLGIYSYALEEFGKALLFRDYLDSNGDSYDVGEWIFGFGRSPQGGKPHEEKINRAIVELGSNFNEVYPGMSISKSVSSNRTVDLGIGNSSISIPKHTTGKFQDITNGPMPIDFEFRKLCFFVGWNGEDDWEKRPKVIHTDFSNLLSEFSDKINLLRKTLNDF